MDILHGAEEIELCITCCAWEKVSFNIRTYTDILQEDFEKRIYHEAF